MGILNTVNKIFPVVAGHQAAYNAIVPRKRSGGASASGGGGGSGLRYSDRDIADQFKRVLGRDPRGDELDFFLNFTKENDLTPYDVGQILGGSEEAQQSRLTQQTDQYSQTLGKYDDQVLSKAQDQIRGDYARMGRPSSSGATASFAGAAQNLAMQRQNQLADFYGGGLQNIGSQYQATGGNALARGYGMRDEKRQRGYQISDYYTQQNDFNNYLKGQHVRNQQDAVLKAGLGLGGGLIGPGLTSGMGGLGAASASSGLMGSGGANLGYAPPPQYNSMQGFYNGSMRRYKNGT